MRWPPWRVERAVHEPAKVLLDLAIVVALSGDCAADIAVVRAQPALFGEVASDPTVSRLIATVAADVEAAIAVISAARAQARERARRRRHPVQGSADNQVIIDLDATLVTTHSEKQFATPTFKYGFGFHPLLAFCDHGVEGSGETLAAMLRPGSKTANIAADLIAVLDAALGAAARTRTCPGAGACRHRRWVKAFLHHITDLGLHYSVGFYAIPPVLEALANVPRQPWRAAIDGDGLAREGP